jgi:hypothetical protein
MSVRLVDEIVQSFESHRFEYRAAMAACSDRQCSDIQFAECWTAIFADAEQDPTCLQSPAVQAKIVRRLLRLGRLMRERFWDFAIAERLSEEDFYTAVAVRLLAHASAGHDEELRFCLNRSRPLFPVVAKRHAGLFGEIQLELSTGLPPTPALSQAEMARALGVSYDTFRGDVRAGHWRPVKSDAFKHRRYRRWRHVTAAKQAEALKGIRRRFRRILWSKLPAERGHRSTPAEPGENVAKKNGTW